MRTASAPAETSARAGAARRLEPLELGEDLGEKPGALGDDRVPMDRLEVLLAGADEAAVAKLRVALGHPPHHLADAVLDEPRAAMGALDHLDLVGALHQLVDLGAHRLLHDVKEVAGVDLDRGALGTAYPQRSDPALIVR